MNGDFGKMVAVSNNQIKAVPLTDVAGKLKTVPPDCETVLLAKEAGICFGD